MSNIIALPIRNRPLPPHTSKDPLEDTDSKAYQVREFINSVEISDDLTEASFMAWGRNLIWEYVVALAKHGDEASPALPDNGAAAVVLFMAFCEHPEQTEPTNTILGGSSVTLGYQHVLSWVLDQLYTHPESSAS